MSNNRKKFPIWIPITSLVLAIILNPNAVQMLSRGMISSGMVEIFGAFLLYCFLLYIGNSIFNSRKK
ncbi:hypothetical protein [Moraxella lacunata]|uniref:hypothetical protein n=1 Tax=Moraxella lacunata TaxID=477 RepID=UPI0012EAD06F|nr:hypothetical protein [Moraxella lacunata]MDI4506306.1 hypothetical protein [Moraxella lacunata]